MLAKIIGALWATIDFLQAYNGAVTAVATVFIGAFTYVLARVTGRQVRLARDEFRATHRPRIVCLFFESFTGVGDDDDGVEITYVNAGTAPAVMIEIGKQIVPTQNLRPGVLMDIVPLHSKVLASGAKDKTGIGHLAVSMASVIADHPNLGPGAPTYCIGYIAYEDTAGLRRETGFCRLLDIKTNRWLPVKDSDYEYGY